MLTTQNFQRFLLIGMFMAGAGFAANEAEFNSPEQAVDALHQAVKSNDPAAIARLIGPLASSEDGVQDKADRERFIQKYSEMHRLVKQTNGTAVLYIGGENWPFPVPLASTNGKWRFDVETGAQEITFRRIGEDETTAIERCREIAAHSAPPPVERFHGYQFRVLSESNGAVVVAYPSEYGLTGVMTFVVTPKGAVYEKDLGVKTPEVAQKMARYKSDRSWRVAEH